MASISLADISRVTPIVLGIRQRQASLRDAQDRLLRILRSRLDVQSKQRRGIPGSREIADQGCDAFGVVESGNAFECRLKRLEALLLQLLDIHARCKEIAILLFERACGFRGGSGQFPPKFMKVALLKERVGSKPAHLVTRNWIVLDPVAACILIEVGTGVG